MLYIEIWCTQSYLFNTMSCPKDQITGLNFLLSLSFTPSSYDTWYPFLIYISWHLKLFILQSIVNAFLLLLFFSLFLSVYPTFLLSSLTSSASGPLPSSIYSPKVHVCLFLYYARNSVKCLNLQFIYVITTIQDSFSKTGNPSLWKIAQKCSCPSFLIL